MHKRKLFLESAKAEFLEKGFENTSLKEICQKAQVTTGALYKRYTGKEDLFCAVVSETVEMLTKIEDEKSSMSADTLTDEELISLGNERSFYDVVVSAPISTARWISFADQMCRRNEIF